MVYKRTKGYGMGGMAKKTKGYEFLANIITSDILRWNLKDLAAKDKKS